MSQWKQAKKLGIHSTLENVLLGLKDVIELELEKANKKVENLKRIQEMKEKKNDQ